MWQKLEAIMAPYTTFAAGTQAMVNIYNLINSFELHRTQGESVRNAAIDALIELLQAEKTK